MTERTDPHRPGAIVPQDYEDVLWYDCGGFEEPSWGVNCGKPVFDWHTLQAIPGASAHAEGGECCVLGLKMSGQKFAETGREHGTGKCTVCGAVFRFGQVWRHVPTGDLIHIGHDCAEKYGLVASRLTRSEWAQYKAALDQKHADAAKDMKRARKRDRFLEDNGLVDVFAVREGHPILKDMYKRLHQWGSLSEKQIAFARKLAEEVRNPPPPKPVEVKVAAPIAEGRQEFTGVIVSAKLHEGEYGVSTKITVKMTTPEGIWLAWGTCPAGVHGSLEELRGRQITIKATLSAGNEPHFAFFKRPTLVASAMEVAL